VECDTFKNTLQDLSSLAHQKVLLAHSGGVDSCVLAQLLLNEKISFVVAHCNYQLRAEASDADEKFVIDWCKANQISFFTKRFDTELYKKRHKQSTQLAARNLRYYWFDELKQDHGFTILLTAHHLNDQFETFLMRTTRGTGINGLLGIQDTDWIQRPLKEIPKSELLAYANRNQIEWREDQSNQSDDYLRNEFRHHLVEPWLKAHPDALKNFKTTLNHLTEADLFIQTQLKSLKKQWFQDTSSGTEIAVAALNQLPQKAFCIHHWFSDKGFSAKEVIKLMQTQKGKVLTSSSHRLIREHKTLVLCPLKKSKKTYFPINLNGVGEELPISLQWEELSSSAKIIWKAHQAALDKKKLKFPLFLRKYEKGDYFYPTGMKGKKLLSKFFKDEKYTTLEKESQWLLCCGDAVVWVIGKRCDQRFVSDEKSEEILLMQLEV
jgi:tRNA(Ile)-lysidine synthase